MKNKMENFMYLKGFRRKASSERKKMKLLFIYCERGGSQSQPLPFTIYTLTTNA